MLRAVSCIPIENTTSHPVVYRLASLGVEPSPAVSYDRFMHTGPGVLIIIIIIIIIILAAIDWQQTESCAESHVISRDIGDSDSDSDIYFQTTTEHVVTIMQKNRNVGRLGKRMAWIGRLPAQPVLHT